MTILKYDATEIITKHFNHNFNEFIGLGSSSKLISTFRTGGLKEFESKSYHVFNRLASELERFRDEFIKNYGQKQQIEKEEIKKALQPLIVIYEEGASYKKLSKATRDILNENFINSSKKFFKEIDNLYGFSFFGESLSKIPVSQDIISDYDFARQYFGKASSSFGPILGKKELEKLEKDYLEKPELKEKIEQFARTPFIDTKVTSIYDPIEIITKYFNGNFNEFIALDTSSESYRVFSNLVTELEIFRDKFVKNYSHNEQIKKEEIKKALHPLIEIYQEGASYNRLDNAQRYILNKNFINSSKKFFKEIDNLYNFSFFSEILSNIQVSQESLINNYSPILGEKIQNKSDKMVFFAIIIVSILVFATISYIFLFQNNDEAILQEANEKCATALADSFCNVKNFTIKGRQFSCYWDIQQKLCIAK